jgi:replicative DNA helicase
VDLPLEREVLGAAMAHDRTLELRALGVSGDDFARAAHRLVWQACVAIADSGGVTSAVTVWERLRADKTIDDVGAADLLRMVDGVPRGPLTWQVQRLQLLAQARRVARSLGAVRDLLAEDAEALTDGTVDTHLDLLRAQVTRRPTARVLTPAAQWAALVQEAQRDPTRRLPLGLPALDAALGGLRPGEVCGLMARPGTGKTLAVCHIVAHLGRAGRRLLVCSLEMPAAQILARLAGMVYGEAPRGIWAAARDGRHTAAQWADRLPHVALCDQPGLSVADIEATVRAQAEPVELLVIDYLGLLGGDRRMSTYDRVSTQAREIKDLAKRQDCAVLLVIQVSREAGGAYGERQLSLGSARDSGVVEEALDYLLGLRRLDRVPTLDADERARQRDVLWLSLLKHRHGPVPHQEWPYAIHDVDLHLVEQDGLTVPVAVSQGELYDMTGRRSRR